MCGWVGGWVCGWGPSRLFTREPTTDHTQRKSDQTARTDGAADAVEGDRVDVLEGDVQRGLVDEDERLVFLMFV